MTLKAIAWAAALTPFLAPPLAAQEIALSGAVEMGLVGGSGAGAPAARLLTELDLSVILSTTTDGGLTFAAEFDLSDLSAGEDPRPGLRRGAPLPGGATLGR